VRAALAAPVALGHASISDCDRDGQSTVGGLVTALHGHGHRSTHHTRGPVTDARTPRGVRTFMLSSASDRTPEAPEMAGAQPAASASRRLPRALPAEPRTLSQASLIARCSRLRPNAHTVTSVARCSPPANTRAQSGRPPPTRPRSSKREIHTLVAELAPQLLGAA
jgi:hypothetical protein